MHTIFSEPDEPIAGKRYIYDQIMDWVLLKKKLCFSEMTNISQPVQADLEKKYTLNTLSVADIQADSDDITKFLFVLRGSKPEVKVESVFIPGRGRITACLSTQSGCACGCVFCATGQVGPGRNLHFSEIILQLLNMEKKQEKRVSHIVLMGMGEPLHNYQQVVKTIEFLEKSKLRISARRITLSTIGLPAQIRKLTDDGVRVELAVSLHSAIEEKRKKLIPYKGLSSIDELMKAVDYFYIKTKRLPTFEYVMIKDLNDRQEDIKALAELLKHRPCKVNLIAMNGKINGHESPAKKVAEEFCSSLNKKGIKTTIRRSAGSGINAACGQLRGKIRQDQQD
ncbi:23S rRNA (adenine(2503)-C(2))-methyltransferase RlmN [Verrucomicrobiota bacterium]